MIQPRPETKRRIAEARARMLALAIAGQAKWQVREAGSELPPAGAGYLYAPQAHLLLVPTTAGVEFAQRQAEPAIRAARSDALVISRTIDGSIAMSLGLWTRSTTNWPDDLSPWLGTDGTLWLAISSVTIAPLAYPLTTTPLKTVPAPWCSACEFDAGMVRASAWLGSF